LPPAALMYAFGNPRRFVRLLFLLPLFLATAFSRGWASPQGGPHAFRNVAQLNPERAVGEVVRGQTTTSK
jgi:hypothetical protein